MKPRFRTTVGLAVLLILVLGALVPMAFASPPDQSWLGGLYDNDDFDNVVLLARSTAAIVVALAPVRVSAPTYVVPLTVPPAQAIRPAPGIPSCQLRAPPAA